jgi:hypothetical protein
MYRVFFIFLLFLSSPLLAQEPPSFWQGEWPGTDFSKSSVDFAEIVSGGPPKDGIPAIDAPRFESVSDYDGEIGTEAVVSLELAGEARAYPLRVLIWHEIANDEIGGLPLSVTYCPLCNAAIVFDRRLEGRVLDFGTTGKLRNSDLIMYDRQTESWWQQFLGEAIVGELTGKRLKVIPSRLESLESFAERNPEGRILVPSDPDLRPYGVNPYDGYDSSGFPFLYRGETPEGIPPLAYVVAVGDEAWTLDLLKAEGAVTSGDLTIEWRPGMSSALDSRVIDEGRDIGQVTVTRSGELVAHDVTFAFVFHAFRPEGTINR